MDFRLFSVLISLERIWYKRTHPHTKVLMTVSLPRVIDKDISTAMITFELICGIEEA